MPFAYVEKPDCGQISVHSFVLRHFATAADLKPPLNPITTTRSATLINLIMIVNLPHFSRSHSYLTVEDDAGRWRSNGRGRDWDEPRRAQNQNDVTRSKSRDQRSVSRSNL